MKPLIAFATVAGLLLATAAGAAPLQRVRGTIVAASAGTLTMRTLAGPIATIALTPATKYAGATTASLGDVQTGKFIGTATKDIGGRQRALEIAVFAEPLRGTGEGHYPWDSVAGGTAAAPGAAGDSMTNGNVATTLPPMAANSMTNGNVQAASTGAGGETLTVSYHGGTQTIVVPPGTPVVLLTPASRAILKPGASVFVLATMTNGRLTARAISAGENGTKLPM